MPIKTFDFGKSKIPKKARMDYWRKKSFYWYFVTWVSSAIISFAKTGNGKEREIIDGLQRLDAIFSFIKQEFPVKWEGKEYYCNKDALFCTSEVFEQKYPVLDFDFCMQFGEYELPTTTTDVADSDTVNEIFKRINYTGKKLTKQDLRQAGIVSRFSDLVSKTAANIRGDITLEIALIFLICLKLVLVIKS